jgi:hypothetical protein
VGTFTTSPFPQPQVPSPAQAIYFAQSQYIVMPTQFKAAYTIQWTMSVQHQFPHDWQAQLDYIGNATRHDPMSFSFDPAVYIPGNWGAGGTGCTGIVTTGPGKVTAGASGTPCSTTKNYRSRFLLTTENPIQGDQYAGGATGSNIVGDEGTANYNGLVSSIQHRLSSTFSLLANWTWSKCLNEEDAQGDLANEVIENPNRPALDYGPCGSDYRHILNTSVVARSEFARFNRLTKAVINGWELAPLMRIQSGAPFTVTQGADDSLTDIGNDRPNLVANMNPYSKVNFRKGTGESNREFLNPLAFQPVCPNNVTAGCAAAGTYGNIGRNSFRGPKSLQLDAQISRIFPIHENLAATVRLEAFNVLNHPDFNPPSSSTTGSLPANTGGAATLTSSTFGQVSSTLNQARVFQGSIKIAF